MQQQQQKKKEKKERKKRINMEGKTRQNSSKCVVLQWLQKSHHVCVALVPGQIDGPAAPVVPGVRVGGEKHQEPDGVQEAAPGRVVQRRGPGAAVGYVGVRSVVE